MRKKLSKTFHKIKKSKDAQTLLANFGYLSLLQIASSVFPLITIPYLARVIGVEGFGKIAFASAIVIWFQTIADWGFSYTATRDVAKSRDNSEAVSEIFSNVLWARILLCILSLIILIVAILSIPKFKENSSILLVTFLLIPGHILYPDWFFQALERMKFITILNLLAKLLFTILVFIFIKEKSDYILQPLFTTLGFIMSGLIAMYLIVFKWKIRIKPPQIRKVLFTIKGSTDVFINNIMPNLYNSFSTVLLGFFGGSASTGILDAGGKFAGICQQFMGIISRVFFPFLSRRIDKHKQYLKINLFFSILFTAILFFAAPIIIKIFFTAEFLKAVIVLRIMAFSVLFNSLNDVYGKNYLIINGYERELRNVTVICSILGFIISFPLIYLFDYIGAAITISVTRAMLALSITFKAKQYIIS